MTNERAVEILNLDLDILGQYGGETAEAYKMAIQALEAQPCEDCISREEINEFINVQLTDNEEWASSATNEGRWVEEKKYLYGVEILEGLSEYVNDLPSVKPERPKGEWIFKDDNIAIPTGYYQCSECGEGKLLVKNNFCPNCGAEMGGADETN